MLASKQPVSFKAVIASVLSMTCLVTILSSQSAYSQTSKQSNWTVPVYDNEDLNPNQQTLSLVVSPNGKDLLKAWSNCGQGLECGIRTSFSRDEGKTWSSAKTVFLAPWSGQTQNGFYAFGFLTYNLINSIDGKIAALIVNVMTNAPGTQEVSRKSKYVMHTFDGGKTWTNPILIFTREFDTSSEVPQVLWNEQINGGPSFKQIDGSKNFRIQTITWTEGYKSSNGSLINRAMISMSYDSGRTWSQSASLNVLSGQQDTDISGFYIQGSFRPNIRVSSDGSRIIATWADWSGSIFSTTSMDSGRSWSRRVQVCSNSYETTLAVSSDFNTIYALCPVSDQLNNPQQWSIDLVSSQDSGLTWSNVGNLPFTSSSRLEVTPGEAMLLESKGRLFVVLTEKKSGENPTWKIFTSSSSDGGKTWTQFREESRGRFSLLSGATSTSPNGELQLGWWELDGYFVWSKSRDFGKTWEEQTKVGQGEIRYPSLVVASNNDQPFLIYFAFRGIQFNVATQTYTRRSK